MQEEHHDADDQQNVNEATRNVKGQKSKQLKNYEHCGDYSKPVFDSLSSERALIGNPLMARSTDGDLSPDSRLGA